MKAYEVKYQTWKYSGVQVALVLADSKAAAVMIVGNTYNVNCFHGVRRVKA